MDLGIESWMAELMGMGTGILKLMVRLLGELACVELGWMSRSLMGVGRK